ncbi:MAG: PA0069 family radical SAM protein [Hyphomicrobiaceae bacterium]
MKIDAGLVGNQRRRGRGARTNVSGRYETETREDIDDGWSSLEDLEPFRTHVQVEAAKSIISTNTSPDLSFDQSINPYRGCEHGCSYCYARPNHTYMGLSAGLDFETRLFAKTNAADLLRKELAAPRYQPKTIALGAVTDPYQPIERTHKISRAILEVLDETSHPVAIVTKSALVTRDIDILSRLAERGLAKVALSITSLDRTVARKMEPRASTPSKRLDAIRQLTDAGIPATVMTAPIIPSLNDWEIERILEAARDAGATQAGYVLLRLPHEIKHLFREWLVTEFPDRADRVINLLREMRGGKDYDTTWGRRQTGQGPYAMQIKARYKLALRRLGMNNRHFGLRTDLFEPPVLKGGQMRLL